jgi:hypothetical protein
VIRVSFGSHQFNVTPTLHEAKSKFIDFLKNNLQSEEQLLIGEKVQF